MKKGIVYLYGWQRGVEEITGMIAVEPPLVQLVRSKDEDYQHLTIPLTSVMMIEWEK